MSALPTCLRLRYLLVCTLWCAALQAQYAGGRADGFTQRSLIEVTFDGIPAGVRALFTGGRADGHAFRRYSGLLLSTSSLTTMYAGGSGDGADRMYVQQLLSGRSLQPLYLGGAGDGFDRSGVQLLIGGGSLSTLFEGGNGDGFDGLLVSTLVSGFSLAALYRGGGGDGFDRAVFFGGVPTPLTLLSFGAFPDGNLIVLRWQTENEFDTDFFTVEKTVDGRLFAQVDTLAAAGYTQPGDRPEYALTDIAPHAGTSYYRLRTTDFDGTISLSHLVAVHRSDASGWSFSLFPNPNTGRHLSIGLQGVGPQDALVVEVYDAAGRLLLIRNFSPGTNAALRLEFRERLTSGSYLVRTVLNKSEVSAKVLIVR